MSKPQYHDHFETSVVAVTKLSCTVFFFFRQSAVKECLSNSVFGRIVFKFPRRKGACFFFLLSARLVGRLPFSARHENNTHDVFFALSVFRRVQRAIAHPNQVHFMRCLPSYVSPFMSFRSSWITYHDTRLAEPISTPKIKIAMMFMRSFLEVVHSPEFMVGRCTHTHTLQLCYQHIQIT